MNKIIATAKLFLPVNIHLVQEEVKAITHSWVPHFNRKHYEGQWTVLSLRSIAGVMDAIIPEALEKGSFEDTALMKSCPSIQHLISTLKCNVNSVRLLNLKKGAEIKEHRDADLAFEKGEARLHIPVITNENVQFYLDGKLIKMEEGECWYINANLPHKVSNKGTTDRVHLVIDCIVNDWLKEVFSSADKVFAAERKNHVELQKIIDELHLQNTPTSLRLAKELSAGK